MPAVVILLAGRSHPVGAILYDDEGNAVRVTKPYGVNLVRDEDGRLGHQHGYACERVDSGVTAFYPAGYLFDSDGFVTHISLVKGAE